MNLAFLPATDPDDKTYGTIPGRIAGYPDASIRQVRYPALVWYNQAARDEAIAQIRSWDVAPLVLIGFSKSGLGAWNIARALPELVAATIIFDAPVASEQLPGWGTSEFYADDREWQKDLPARTIRAYRDIMPASHQLLLISGESFHEEMATFSQALSEEGVSHVFRPHPDMKHHWNTGWIEEALGDL